MVSTMFVHFHRTVIAPAADVPNDDAQADGAGVLSETRRHRLDA
jgi:hypothetical protein